MPLVPPGAAPAAKPQSNEVEKKESYWKRSAEKRREERKIVITFLENCGKPLSPEVKAIVDAWKNPVRPGAAFGEPLFNKIFGEDPKVGATVTLQEVFNKTFKGVDKMHSLMRKWAEKGVATVEYVHNAAEPIKSQYVIRKIGE